MSEGVSSFLSVDGDWENGRVEVEKGRCGCVSIEVEGLGVAVVFLRRLLHA